MNIKTVAEAEHYIRKLRAMSNDPEAAHSMEDKIHIAALKAVVEENPEAKAIARIALETLKLHFSRWCA